MKRLKRILCLLAALAIAMAVFGCAKAETKTGAQETVVSEEQSDTSQAAQIVVIVNVDGSDGGDKAIGCGGQIELPAGSTAYDALKDVCDANELEITGDPSYVKTIGGLGEGSFGAAACGWMFDVNGEYPSVSANEYELKDGDEVTWTFVK